MRTRLAIVIAIGTLGFVLATEALADSPPTTGSPGDGATFTAGDQIIFEGTATATPPPLHVYFYISKDNATNPDGSLSNSFAIVRGDPTSDPAIFDGTAGPANIWPVDPRDYYWQVYQDCAGIPVDCLNWSQVRKLTINQRPASSVSVANPPDTFLTDHPRRRVHQRKARFAFSSDVAGANFQCLYAKGWAACKSPHIFRHLEPGRYRFQTRAIVNGVEDPSPASWTFKVRH
jgi:hypothetical protein